jgi:tetratricopeptide (TPR) repeat protein
VPVDPRRLAVAIACSLVVAAVVVGLALAQRSPAPAVTPKACGKPLTGRPPLRFDLPTRYLARDPGRLQALGDPARNVDLALGLTAAQLDAGNVSAARHDLSLAATHVSAEDVRIAVASTMLGWSRAQASDVGRTLEGIASDAPSTDAFPLVERGLVSLWQGCTSDAASWFAEARTAAPDSFYGVLADDLLHPNQNQSYPPFVASEALPGGSLAVRRRAAAEHPDSVTLALAYAVALQDAGRRTDARAAAEQAVAADPTEIDAQVAAIVLGYDKDSPATAVGALGMLIKNDPRAPSPVLHLGFLLLWIKRTALAKQEFAKAVMLDPSGRLGRVAKAFLENLNGPGG